jgi:hypothetical protein
MTIEAKPVVKNKYWIVEDDGRKIATIQAADDGVVLVQDNRRLKYPSIKVLGTAHNIRFVGGQKTQTTAVASVYDYPSRTIPYNAIYDLKLRLPLYTTTKSSRSYYCAGYYLIRYESGWVKEFSPKKIILTRNQYLGPFRTSEECNQQLAHLNTDK